MDILYEMLAVVSLRDIVMLFAVLLAVYILVLLIRLSRIPKHQKTTTANDKAHHSSAAALDGHSSRLPLSASRTMPNGTPYAASRPVKTALQREPTFDNYSATEPKEARNFRVELDKLRSQVARLENTLEETRQEVQTHLSRMRLTQNASHQYSDAMGYAASGMDARSIAERCAISRAEAELVVSLAETKTKARQL